MKYAVLLGRILLALPFLLAGFGHFSEGTIGYATMKGVPMAGFLVPFTGIMALVGAISLILGFKAKWGALIIIIFLIPVTIYMHNFWAETDKMQMQMQMSIFMKNFAMAGAALLITYFGAGPLSIDGRQKKA